MKLQGNNLPTSKVLRLKPQKGPLAHNRLDAFMVELWIKQDNVRAALQRPVLVAINHHNLQRIFIKEAKVGI